MRFILGLLVGYCIRGKQRLLIATLSAIAVGCFILLPAIALSLLALDVRRERLSRPPQRQCQPRFSTWLAIFSSPLRLAKQLNLLSVFFALRPLAWRSYLTRSSYDQPPGRN